MRSGLAPLAALLLIGLPCLAQTDGTTPPVGVTSEQGSPGGSSILDDAVYTINPFESVSINATSTWPDNRHRAYWNSSLLNVNGFLLFDVSAIPDGANITSMTLRCYLENAFGSPNSNPVVDVYYSADDGWTRSSATPGSLSLDTLLANDVPFTTYVTSYDFVLDVGAHNWSGDLLDDQICIGFKNDVSHYSFVYFFGAYGSPTGSPPELIIETGGCQTPVVYCTAGQGTSSSGCFASISTSNMGACPVSGANDYDVTISAAEGNKPGIIFYGYATAAIPFSSGTLCVLPPLKRSWPQNTGGGAGCNGSMLLRINDPAGVDHAAGTLVFFQGWNRDPASGVGTDVSDAVEVLYN